LQELASRILETRAVEGNPEVLARDLLTGFCDVCLRSGLDGVLEALALTDDVTEHPELRSALAAKLGNKADFDPRGPRNAKPKQLVDCVLAVLGLTVIDEPDRTITLGDDVRTAVTGALATVIDVELAVPKIREDIVARARAGCEERHRSAFDKITAQLDDQGMRMIRQPKVPLDAVQATQHLLLEARHAVIAKAAHAAIDRAKQVLARASTDAAERIDQPITLRLTPRDVAIERVADARVSKAPAAVALALFESLSELARLAWRSQERPVRAYGASQTFAVGELIEHPRFGRGEVKSVATQHVEVEFPDGKYTLVHARK
jgi:hypothetical protein